VVVNGGLSAVGFGGQGLSCHAENTLVDCDRLDNHVPDR
jgi:hypothetical protein